MRVLVDENGKVYAIGDKNVRTARRPEGSQIQDFPDDTVFERVSGGFVVSEKQRLDRGWQEKKDRQTRLMQRRENAMERKHERLETVSERIERIEAMLGIENG